MKISKDFTIQFDAISRLTMLSTLSGKKRHQPTLTNFFVKKSKCESDSNPSQPSTSKDVSSIPSKCVPTPLDSESDEESIDNNYFGLPQDLSSKGEPRKCQPANYVYPQKKVHKEMRAFSQHWHSTYEWLEYSESRDAVYCKVCRHFAKSLSAYSARGFSNWKNIGSSLAVHNQTKRHKTAHEDHKAFMMTKRVTTGTVADQLNDADTIYSQKLVSDDEHFDL